MAKVNREEIVQWATHMASLALEFNEIYTKRLLDRKDFSDYREVLNKGELLTVLEKLKKVPVPKEKLCEAFVTDTEKRLKQLIEEMEGFVIDAKTFRLAPAPGPFYFLSECLDALGKKYHIGKNNNG